MDYVRIAIIDTGDIVLSALDNSVPDALHYYEDSLHLYLNGGAHTFSFKADARHPDSEYLTVGNKLAFCWRGKDYYLNIMNCIRDEDTVEVQAYSLSFELLNEYVGAYSASSAMTFEEYLEIFDPEGTITLGNNEIQGKSITNEWTGTDTILNRLLSLASVFDAEIEFVPVLNNNYTLEKLVMHVYEKHSEESQGVGAYREDIVLRYGVEVEGITKTSDATELFTAIRPVGTDGLTVTSLEKEVLDKDGNVEFYTESGSDTIYAPLARNRVPSNTLSDATDRYIVKVWSYETENVNMLYGQALAQLKANCDPKVSYSMEGYFDLDIGDTVRVYDEEFTPPLYLSARVSEQVISFTDPSRCSTTMGNFVELESEINSALMERMKALIEQNKAYVCTISSNNGIVFKNGTGTTVLSAVVRDNGTDVTDKFTIKWYIDGLEVSSGKTITVDASTLTGSAVYRFDAVNPEGVIKGSYEVTVSSVEDGAPGKPGSAGISITNVEIQYYKSTSQTDLVGGEWVTDHPELEKGSYIWEKTVVTYSNGATTETLPVNTTLEVKNLLTDYATIENLNATNAVIASLSGDFSSFQTSVTQELIAAKGWMAEGAIGSAQISDLNANKIRSGTLDTAVVTVAGSDGRLQIADNTLQISDAERVRVQIGKDASGDYTLAVWDAQGKLIWDALGATENTIQRAIIRDSMVAGDAAIQALKIDFQSFETALTDQGVTISGTVVQVGNKTLNVALSEQSQAISDQQETLADHWTAIQANQESIALKVSSQEFTSYKSTVTAEITTAKNEAVSTAAADAADKADQALADAKTYTTTQITTVNNHLSTVDSSISALQGEIELKVEQTDIDSAVTEMEGYTDSRLSSYSTTTQMTAAINAKADEITLTVSNTYATKNSLTDVEDRLATAESAISQQANEIELRVKETDITGNYLIGKINLSSTTATIAASHINLTGAVTISSLASDTKEQLDSAVADVKVYYALSSSTTTAPTSGWSTTAPAWQQGKYMWQKTVTINSAGETIESAPTCISGATGQSGTDGTSVTVTSTSVTYQASNSGTVTPTGTWSASVPSTSVGQYLWTKTVVNYSDGKATTAYSVSRNGSNGSNGTSITIVSQAVTYQVSTSGTTTPTGAWSSSIPSTSAGQYLWTRTVVTYSDGTSTTSYSISRNGTNGAAGADGQMLYATCSTAAATAAKVATLSSGTLSLKSGATVSVKFTYANSVANPTLNVAGTGAKAIRVNGAALTSAAYYWVANAVVSFVYDGSYWNVSDAGALSKANSALTTANTANTTANTALTNANTAQTAANTANNRATYHYASCSTAAGTVAKVAALSGFSLYTGAIVSVYFSNANTAANPTLNVNGTGAKSIRVKNANITAAYYWAAGDTITFIYSGTYWIMAESSAKTNIANWCYNNNLTYIDGGAIYAKSIKAAQIDVDNLFAQNITATGTITGATIKGANGEFTKGFNVSVPIDGVYNFIQRTDENGVLIGVESEDSQAISHIAFDAQSLTLSAYTTINMTSRGGLLFNSSTGNAVMSMTNGDLIVNGVGFSSLTTRSNTGVFHKCGHVVTVNAWGDAATSVLFNISSGWWPANGRGTASGWAYRSDLNQYYPCVAQWDGAGICSAYAIASLGNSNNNYTIYSSTGGIDNRGRFTVFLSGAWFIN